VSSSIFAIKETKDKRRRKKERNNIGYSEGIFSREKPIRGYVIFNKNVNKPANINNTQGQISYQHVPHGYSKR
jgi:hypothetical protein